MELVIGELSLRWMERRVRGATDEELKGFIRHPMHPKMTGLAIEEVERRQRLEDDDS